MPKPFRIVAIITATEDELTPEGYKTETQQPLPPYLPAMSPAEIGAALMYLSAKDRFLIINYLNTHEGEGT